MFTDECLATFDEQAGWSFGCIFNCHQLGVKFRGQKGGDAWDDDFSRESFGEKDVFIGPFKVDQGLKVNSECYCELLDKYLM